MTHPSIHLAWSEPPSSFDPRHYNPTADDDDDGDALHASTNLVRVPSSVTVTVTEGVAVGVETCVQLAFCLMTSRTVMVWKAQPEQSTRFLIVDVVLWMVFVIVGT